MCYLFPLLHQLRSVGFHCLVRRGGNNPTQGQGRSPHEKTLMFWGLGQTLKDTSRIIVPEKGLGDWMYSSTFGSRGCFGSYSSSGQEVSDNRKRWFIIANTHQELCYELNCKEMQRTISPLDVNMCTVHSTDVLCIAKFHPWENTFKRPRGMTSFQKMDNRPCTATHHLKLHIVSLQ